MKKSIAIGLLFLFLATEMMAQIPDTAHIPKAVARSYVLDDAGVLSPDQLQDLNEHIWQLEQKTSVQLGVVLIHKLPDNMEIEDYARKVGRLWKVGNGHNGLVYVAAIDQHKQRLEVADHLSGTITDDDALEITDGLKPDFRKSDYYHGLLVLVSELDTKIAPAAIEQKGYSKVEQAKKGDKDVTLVKVFGLSIFLFGLCYLIASLIRVNKRQKREREAAAERNRTYATANRAYIIGAEDNDTIPRFKRNSEAIIPPPAYVSPSVQPSYTPPDDEDDTPSRSSSSGSSSSSSSSSSDSSTDFGNFGGGGTSGFSGGGATNDW